MIKKEYIDNALAAGWVLICFVFDCFLQWFQKKIKEKG